MKEVIDTLITKLTSTESNANVITADVPIIGNSKLTEVILQPSAASSDVMPVNGVP